MARVRTVKNVFAFGELSPRMRAREELESYRQGALRTENMLAMPHGGTTRRPGTRFVAEVKDSTKRIRLIPFRRGATGVNDQDQTYILEFGDLYFRVYTDRAQVESGGSPVEVATPYAEADLEHLQFGQDGDEMYLVHPSHKPRKITWTSDTSWSIANYAPTADPFTSVNNFPSAVALFQGRIVFGATNNNPQTLWFSVAGDLNNMTTGTGDSDGFNKTLATASGVAIRWIYGGADLLIGTTGGEFLVDRPTDRSVTVTNFAVRRIDAAGVAYEMPAEVDDQALFLQRNGHPLNDGQRLLQLGADPETETILARDLSLHAEHIVKPGIDEMAWAAVGFDGSYQGRPVPGVDRVLWCVRSDGTLLSFTFDPRNGVAAWARHVTDGSFESVAVIPGSEGDEVWVAVNRTIDGATKRYVEWLDPDLFMDSALTQTNDPATATITGLDHLEAKTVRILADEGLVDSKTVSGGQVTLDEAASDVMIGLDVVPLIETMPIAPIIRSGRTQGAEKAVGRVGVHFLDTVGVRISGSDATGSIIPFRIVSDDLEDPIPPFTGTKEVLPPTGWAKDVTVVVDQPDPLPITILALIIEADA